MTRDNIVGVAVWVSFGVGLAVGGWSHQMWIVLVVLPLALWVGMRLTRGKSPPLP
jgi:hypothetical protein